MNDPMGHILRTGTQLEHGKNLRARINGEPKPKHVFIAAQPGAQFVQLQVREVEKAEGAFVQELRVRARASQKGW